jgi:TPR repeat protein
MDKTLSHRWFGRSQLAAVESTRVLAERGVADAQFSLGLNFANGVGVAQDFAQAAMWYLKAAEQSHPLAQFNLGRMYALGQGLPCDAAKSLMWIQKAANLGDAGAQFNLGQAHQRASLHGPATETSAERIMAYKWFRLAANQGYAGSEAACEIMNLKMSREDLMEGGRSVAAFNAARVLTA